MCHSHSCKMYKVLFTVCGKTKLSHEHDKWRLEKPVRFRSTCGSRIRILNNIAIAEMTFSTIVFASHPHCLYHKFSTDTEEKSMNILLKIKKAQSDRNDE